MTVFDRSSRKKWLPWLLFAAAVLLVIFILVRGLDGGDDLSKPEGRQRYLTSLGWEIDPGSEEHKTVRIPAKLEGVLADYNELQRAEGRDLEKHCGERCEQYSYLVTNYPDPDQTVYVTLYIQGRELIAGDIHSTALDGFMIGLQANPAAAGNAQ
jgi:hypothetical protein